MTDTASINTGPNITNCIGEVKRGWRAPDLSPTAAIPTAIDNQAQMFSTIVETSTPKQIAVFAYPDSENRDPTHCGEAVDGWWEPLYNHRSATSTPLVRGDDERPSKIKRKSSVLKIRRHSPSENPTYR